ncbi:MAG TPA: LysM domain-containing protein [Candidatus Acidoferrales bacterium]|nr:LysM domain-containing protein [Candidatus Acidoferrales bacterium]
MALPLFLISVVSALLAASPAAAEYQTWKLRPGDNLDAIAATLDIPAEDIKKHNPGIVENSLQIGQKLKLPLRAYAESEALEQELRTKDRRIAQLESKTAYLEEQIARAQSQLRWHPLWFWGFWICFGILAFLFAGAYWMIRQTHPRVLEQPRERTIRDLRESQIRARSSVPYEEDGAGTGGDWRLSLRRFPHAH